LQFNTSTESAKSVTVFGAIRWISSTLNNVREETILNPGKVARGYFDPKRIHFSAVGIFLEIITRQFTYLLLHSSPYLRCHWHLLRTAGIRDNGRKV